MRVLHAASFFGQTPGGFVPLIAALARHLEARGDRFALVAPRVDGAGWQATQRDALGELHLVDGAAHAAQVARAWRPDIAHVHFFGWEGRVTTALWLQRARVMWHVHSTVTSRPRGRAIASVRSLLKYRALGARVERFIAVSAAIGDELAQQGAPRSRIAVIRNAVDARRFRPPSDAERAAARAQLALDERPAILFFGRDPALKGADVLAESLARMTRPTVVAVATPDETRAALARHADVVALERVDDTVPLFWAADALAMPSRAEGFGLVLMEAMLTGLHVAASDLPALREVAEGHAAVHFAPAGDAEAFATALRASLAGTRSAARDIDDDMLDRWVREVTALYDR